MHGKEKFANFAADTIHNNIIHTAPRPLDHQAILQGRMYLLTTYFAYENDQIIANCPDAWLGNGSAGG